MQNQLDGSSPEPAGSEENGSASPCNCSAHTKPKELHESAKPRSSKGSKRAAMKRVVTVPIAELEVSRVKGEGAAPPDSWSWRKYGQKPIKGSPYPRGYYRCSGSKGCPAKKQVERSRADPTVLIVTYAADHNHASSVVTTAAADSVVVSLQASTSDPFSSTVSAGKLPSTTISSPSTAEDGDLCIGTVDADDDLLLSDEFGWFSQTGALPRRGTAIFHIPVSGGSEGEESALGEEEKSLFADLGELPECSLVFRRVESGRRVGLGAEAPLCGSTG